MLADAHTLFREGERLLIESKPGMRVVEFTGGSTGSSLAFVCAVKGYRTRIASKLGIKNVAGFVHHAIRLGLVSVDTLQ